MKRANNLFQTLISYDNLFLAIEDVNRAHHWRKRHQPNTCTAWVEETKEARIQELQKILEEGFTPKPPRVSRRWDANARKWRTICEPIQWPDQYVHHALIQVLKPILLRGMDHYCCGSIPGRGPHREQRAIKLWMQDLRGTRHELCGDIHHFYDSLTPDMVMARMRQLIKDRRVLDLIWRIVRDGVQIGAYTSQWFANTVLQPLDRLIRKSGLCRYYTRYLDNLTIFGPNKRKLHRLRLLISEWMHEHKLQLKGDWQVFPVAKESNKILLPPPRNGYIRPKARLPDAVGYRYGRGYTIPRKRNLLRLKRALARYRKRRNAKRPILARTASSLLSRLGQLRHCSNRNLYRILFRGEKIIRELKRIVRRARGREVLSWNTYLELRAARKYSRSKATGTPI